MVIKLAYDDDEDLPWDGVWEYVLGPDDVVVPPRRGRTNRRNPPSSDIFDYFLPPIDDARDLAMSLIEPTDQQQPNRGRSPGNKLSSFYSDPGVSKAFPIPASKPLKRDTSLQSSAASSRGSSASASKRRFWRRKEKKEDQPADEEYSIAEMINSFIEDPPEDPPQRVAVAVEPDTKGGKRRGFWRRRSNEQRDDRSDTASIESMLGPWQGGSPEIGKQRTSFTKQKEKGKLNSSPSLSNPIKLNRRGSGSSLTMQSHEKRSYTGSAKQPSHKRRDSLGGVSTGSIAESVESVFLAFTEHAVSDLGSEATNSTRMSKKVEKKTKRSRSKERRRKSKGKRSHDENDDTSLPGFAMLAGLASWINEASFSDSEASSDYSSFIKNNTSGIMDDLSLMTASSDASTVNGRDVSPARAPRQSADRELPALDEEVEVDLTQVSEVHLQFLASADEDLNYRYLPPIMEETRSVRTSDEDKIHQRRLSGSEDERTSTEGSTNRRKDQARMKTASPAMGSRDKDETTSRAGSAAASRASNTRASIKGTNKANSNQYEARSTSSSWVAPQEEIYHTREDILFQSIDDEARAMSSRKGGERIIDAEENSVIDLDPDQSEDRELMSPLSEGRALSPQESQASKSWIYQESESSSNVGLLSPTSRFRLRTKLFGRIRDLPQVPRFSCSNHDGVATRQLTSEDVAEIFPKLRVVSDEASKALVRNSNSFDMQTPAHLQFPMTDSAWPGVGEMQSLYEYEYEKGKHMNVVYCYFGPNPRDVLQVVTYDTPPQNADEGLVSFNKVVVQVEASTVSLMDCFVRRGGEVGERPVSLPNTPGIDLVGKLYRIDKESSRKFDLKVGQRVISLVRSGGNSRYLGVDPSALVKVPEAVDPAEAVCLVESYLAAFQMLHAGQGQLTRYRKASLHGITILVIGGMASNTGRAIAQLSRLAGAKHIFATAKQKHFKKLNSIGVLPLNLDPFVWCANLEGSIDLLISMGEEIMPVHYKLLKTTGTVVLCSEENSFSSTSSTQAPLLNPSTTRMPNIVCAKKVTRGQDEMYEYNLFKEWDEHRTRSKHDLAHLIHLLNQGHIHPAVLDRIPLSKVARAQEIIESKHHAGYIVCEPWLVSKARTVSL